MMASSGLGVDTDCGVWSLNVLSLLSLEEQLRERGGESEGNTCGTRKCGQNPDIPRSYSECVAKPDKVWKLALECKR